MSKVKKVIFYLFYIWFGMVVTTAVVWADRVEIMRSKKRCYLVAGGEIDWKDNCRCLCPQSSRIDDGMWCRNCGHYVLQANFQADQADSSEKASATE
jgi:hypothetical protein